MGGWVGGRGDWGGLVENQFPTFDAEFKFAKIQNSHVEGGWVGRWGGIGGTNFQLLMLSQNLLKSKIPVLRVGGGGGGGLGNQFPTLDTESKFAKIQNSHVWWGGGDWWNQFPTFDAEFKFAKIQNSHVEGGCGVGLVETNFQLLILSSNLLKSKILMLRVGGGGVRETNFQL